MMKETTIDIVTPLQLKARQQALSSYENAVLELYNWGIQLKAELAEKDDIIGGLKADLADVKYNHDEILAISNTIKESLFKKIAENRLLTADLEAAKMKQGIQWISVKDKDKLPKRVHPDYDQSEQILILWNRGVCCGIYRPDAAMFEVPCATIPDEDYQNEITHFAEINLPKQGKEGSITK